MLLGMYGITFEENRTLKSNVELDEIQRNTCPDGWVDGTFFQLGKYSEINHSLFIRFQDVFKWTVLFHMIK